MIEGLLFESLEGELSGRLSEGWNHVQGHVSSCLQMARDKYVVLSDGRRLKVCERADGSEYYNDGGEHKTLRSNQRTSFDGTGNTRSGANETPRKGPVAPASTFSRMRPLFPTFPKLAVARQLPASRFAFGC